MASRPWWTRQEWVLLVDLQRRLGVDPPVVAIERLSEDLRTLGVLNEDPRRREIARDPSYRSVNAVWAQFAAVRGLAERGVEQPVPRRLLAIWREFQEEPTRLQSEANEIRDFLLGSGGVPNSDRDAVRRFVVDAYELLADVVRTVDVLPASNLDEEVRLAFVLAWNDLQSRRVLIAVDALLEEPSVDQRLEETGLTGSQLAFKLVGWRTALREWRSARTADSLRRALRWANVVLGSLEKALMGPGLELFKEFKEGTEAVLDEALPPGGYIPRLVPA